MARKIIAWVTLAAFLVFSWSCVIYRWKPNRLESVKPEKRAAVKISAVQLKSGQKIEFRKKPSVRIQGDQVVGNRIRTISLDRSYIKRPKRIYYGLSPEIVTEDGTVYRDCLVSKILRPHDPPSRSLGAS